MPAARPPTDSSRSSWHRKASRPVTFWLLGLVVLAIVHRWIPQSRWLLVHMATLGLASNSILIWGQHFTDSLLRAKPDKSARLRQVWRIRVLNLGIVVTCVGMVATWPWVTTVGATVVGVAIASYAISLLWQHRRALPARFGKVVHWYAAAAALLPVGAVLGALMSFSQPEPWQGRLMLAHVVLNVLGFVGLTATATLLTLWPTMLRTPMRPWSERLHRFALPGLMAGVLVASTGAVGGWKWVAVVGFGLWLAGFGAIVTPGVATAARKPPRDFPTWSVAAAMAWVGGCVVWLGWQVATAPRGLDADAVSAVTAPLIAGGLVQLVLGAMSYLMPMVMGGGPRVARATHAVMNRAGALRVAVANTALVAFLVVENSWARVVTSLLVFVAYASFLPLMMTMVRTMIAQRKALASEGPATERPRHEPADPVAEAARDRRNLLQAIVGVGGVAALSWWLDRGSRRGSGRRRDVTPTGTTVEVDVSAHDMRFTPDHVQIAAGDRLVLHVTNDDPTQVHDLYFHADATTGRLAPHAKADVDLGVVGEDVEGWCTIVGHRAMGMVFRVQTSDAPAGRTAIDLTQPPGEGFVVRDAVVPALTSGVLKLDLRVTETEQEVAPGWTQTAMTYNGRIMGPPVIASLGQRIETVLRNEGTMGHSIDFHAGDVSPDKTMRTIAPGESLDYHFTAKRSGIWLYHCSTMPMTAHVAAGMYGAVIVAPRGLARVDRQYLLVQQEAYLGPNGGEVDTTKIAAETPDLALWNGHANQYVHQPLEARVGERVRLWVLAAGPSRGTSFHVVGAQFDTVFKEGEWLLRPNNAHGGGAQALDLGPAQGGFVEMVFVEPGTYTFVNHSFVDMERGARGLIRVTA